MSHFGHRVIGHTKAAEEAEIQETGADHFGPRVIGDILTKRRLQRREELGFEKDSRSDPSKKEAKKETKQEAPQEPADEVVEAPVTTSLDELDDALEGNAEFYEGLYSQELLRPAGPRKGALRLFLKFEMGHEDREDRKAEIEAALK